MDGSIDLKDEENKNGLVEKFVKQLKVIESIISLHWLVLHGNCSGLSIFRIAGIKFGCCASDFTASVFRGGVFQPVPGINRL